MTKHKTMDIRDKLITGTFSIGADGRKTPTSWKGYALKLEEEVESSEDWKEKWNTIAGHKIELEKQNDELMQELIDADLRQSPIRSNASMNA